MEKFGQKIRVMLPWFYLVFVIATMVVFREYIYGMLPWLALIMTVAVLSALGLKWLMSFSRQRDDVE